MTGTDARKRDGADLIQFILWLVTLPMEEHLGRIPTFREVRGLLVRDDVWLLIVNDDGPLASCREAANLAREEVLSALERLAAAQDRIGGSPEEWSRAIAGERRLRARLARSRRRAVGRA